MADKINVFTFVNNINKQDHPILDHQDHLSQYVPFLVNRALSGSIDTIMYAQEMNIRPWLDKELQYFYLLYSVKKRNRWSKWMKRTDIDKIETIRKVYGYSYAKAYEALAVLSEEQINKLVESQETGGEQ